MYFKVAKMIIARKTKNLLYVGIVGVRYFFPIEPKSFISNLNFYWSENPEIRILLIFIAFRCIGPIKKSFALPKNRFFDLSKRNWRQIRVPRIEKPREIVVEIEKSKITDFSKRNTCDAVKGKRWKSFPSIFWLFFSNSMIFWRIFLGCFKNIL